MSAMGSYLHQALAAWFRGTAMPTPPATLKISLSTANPGETGAGIVEPSLGNGYTRQTITVDASANPGGGTRLRNNAPVVFGPVTGANWPAVTHVALYDENDKFLAFGPLAVQRVCPVGDTVSFGIGALEFVIK